MSHYNNLEIAQEKVKKKLEKIKFKKQKLKEITNNNFLIIVLLYVTTMSKCKLIRLIRSIIRSINRKDNNFPPNAINPLSAKCVCVCNIGHVNPKDDIDDLRTNQVKN